MRQMIRRRWVLGGFAALVAVNAALWLAAFGYALPRSLGAYFFGPGLVRAEVVMRVNGETIDYLIDRGRVRAKTRTSLTLRERDATLVTIDVAPDATILVNGRVASLTQVRRGMIATMIRENSDAATEVRANG
jgi:hypothetical protein